MKIIGWIVTHLSIHPIVILKSETFPGDFMSNIQRTHRSDSRLTYKLDKLLERSMSCLPKSENQLLLLSLLLCVVALRRLLLSGEDKTANNINIDQQS